MDESLSKLDWAFIGGVVVLVLIILAVAKGAPKAFARAITDFDFERAERVVRVAIFWSISPST